MSAICRNHDDGELQHRCDQQAMNEIHRGPRCDSRAVDRVGQAVTMCGRRSRARSPSDRSRARAHGPSGSHRDRMVVIVMVVSSVSTCVGKRAHACWVS